MTDTRRRITLGEALIRTDETDSSIASELYAPGYKKGRIAGRDVPVRLENEDVTFDVEQDTLGAATNRIGIAYTGPNLEANNAYNTKNAYALIEDPNSNGSNRANSLQDALTRINSGFLEKNPRKPLELGQGTNESSSFFFENEEIESFQNDLINQVLKTNLFHAAAKGNDESVFFKSDAPDEERSFPQGIFGLTKSNVAPKDLYGRYNKDQRTRIKSQDLKSATNSLLQKARNDYFIASALPRIKLEDISMKNLLQSLNNPELKNLRLDGNNNIYKVGKKDDDQSVLGVGNKPSEGFFSDPFDVDEFDKFFQYGAVGVVLKASVYSLPLAILLGSLFIYPLLMYNLKLDEDDESFSAALLSNALSLVPPSLIRLKNELGLFGEELKAESVSGLYMVPFRILRGWSIFFSYNIDFDNFLSLNNIANAIPNKILQSPQFYFSFSRILLREIEEFGNEPGNYLSKDPSQSIFVRFAAVLYKLGTKSEEIAAVKNKKKNLKNVDKKDLRNVRHELFRSKYKRNDSINPLSLKHFDYIKISKLDVRTAYESHSEETNTEIKYSKDLKDNRISREDVVRIEQLIDADYVPFSIQDLRTNEIMALPAFIDSISDSFNANYESTHGYGRTDPVYTYSKTERSIDLSFNLVSFNKDDHNRMYEIVNQLTSMCYPQRSRGQLRVKQDDKKFYQPFSQIQTASPMIRVRLGNILHTNKSVRAYKQIFGDVQLAEELDIFQKANAVIEKTIKELELSLTKNFDSTPIVPLAIDVVSQPGCIITAYDGPKKIDLKIKINDPVAFKAIKLGPLITIATNESLKAIIDDVKDLKKLNESDKFNFDRLIFLVENAKQISVSEYSKADLQVQIERLRLLLPSEDGAWQEFLKPNNNPIVRSFESTEGKGLACFIKSLSFDYNNVPWSTHVAAEEKNDKGETIFKGSQSNIAPMRIKVNMSLAPIHDMPLGLSYDGTIMAPSHPVGVWALND